MERGESSHQSNIWETLIVQHQQQVAGNQNNGSGADADADAANHGLQRTMKNDGTFWMDYDNFLMGFSNIDVVLAFVGNHAKSFAFNFPEKKSNHRCTRAFEVSLLDKQSGVPSRDTVELYNMGIQKTRRGAYHG
jgi:hypothetical protein